MDRAGVDENGFPEFGVGQRVEVIEPSPFKGKEGKVKEVRWTRGEFMYRVRLSSGWNYPFFEGCLKRIP